MSRRKHDPYNRDYPVGELTYTPEGVKFSLPATASLLEKGEPQLINDLPRLVNGGLIANLGHARGGSAILMAHGLKVANLEGKVYSIDAFSGRRGSFLYAKERLYTLGFSDYVELYMGYTEDWGKTFTSRGIVFSAIFVDAGHDYPSVKNDYSLWAPMLRIGGLIAFHDTNQKEVRRVLDEDLIDSPKWLERAELHINRIRVFERRA